MTYLKEKRINLNLTMKQAAEKAGISESMYSLIESGKRHPSVKKAKKLGEILSVDWTVFFEDSAI